MTLSLPDCILTASIHLPVNGINTLVSPDPHSFKIEGTSGLEEFCNKEFSMIMLHKSACLKRKLYCTVPTVIKYYRFMKLYPDFLIASYICGLIGALNRTN